MVIDAIKFPFVFPNLCTISVHLFTGARPISIDLVDDQGRITKYHEALDTELGGDTEIMETCFLFGGIVGGRKMNPEYVAELLHGGSNK